MLKKYKIKIITLGLKISDYFKLNYILFLPLHLDIEPINICNFKCNHCKVAHWDKEKVDLDLVHFLKILNQFPNLKSIKLQGLGEPLLSKELNSLIIECKKRDIHIEFFSNGSIYNPEVWKTINETEKISIIFSIDAASKENFEKIRTGSNFEKVISNVKKIIKNNEQKYSFWTVVNKQNLRELLGIISLAHKIGIPKVTFQTFLSDWKSKTVKEYNKTLNYDNMLEEFNKIKNEAKYLSKKLNITFDIYEGNLLSKKKKCVWPFTSAFIASNGDVVPCCVISDSDVVTMGNVFEMSFPEIWNSVKYKNFRKSIKYHQLNDYCKSCYGEK